MEHFARLIEMAEPILQTGLSAANLPAEPYELLDPPQPVTTDDHTLISSRNQTDKR